MFVVNQGLSPKKEDPADSFGKCPAFTLPSSLTAKLTGPKMMGLGKPGTGAL